MRRTKEDAERTRQALLDAAEQVFLVRGIANATLEAIAAEAGLTRGAIYWHFRNKTDLCAAMLERVELPLEAIQAESDAIAGGDPAAALEAFCIAAIQRAATDPRVRRVYTIVLHRRDWALTGDPLWDSEADSRQRARRLFQAYFQEAEDHGRLRREISPESAAFALEAYILGLFHLWLLPPQTPETWTETAGPLVRAFLSGFLWHGAQSSGTASSHP